MPDLFEEFFASIGENIGDRLDLQKLSPSYKVFYPKAL
jgi:phytoene desaturase